MKRIIILTMIGTIIMTSCEKQPDVAVISTKFGDMVLEFYPNPVSYTHLTLPTILLV